MNMRKRISTLLLSVMMIITMMPSVAFGQSADTSITVEAAKTMELPEKVFSNQWNKSYDAIYRDENTQYTYKGQAVTFTDPEHIEVGGQSYAIRHVDVSVSGEVTESGYNVKISPISQPVGSISGAWNATYGGYTGGVYSAAGGLGTDGILEGSRNHKNKTITFALTNIPDGTTEVKDGAVLERANEWSPGFDFKDGKGSVTSRLFGLLPNLVVKKASDTNPSSDKYIGVNVGSDVPQSFTNDLWTQYDFKELAIGETAKLNPRRVPEAITNPISNDVELPHFNYEIIEGNSVTIDDADNAHAVVTAVAKGTSIVKITYDAFDHDAGQRFEAIDPINTQYVVFTVGNDENIKIQDNIDTNLELKKQDSSGPNAGKISLTSYDTIYFDKGDTTPLDIKVTTENANKLVVKCNGITVSPKDASGNYVLPLENRSNIIEMTATDSNGNTRSLYRVIDARKINIVVTNVTNPGQPLRKGDTAKVSFVGITMPVYKLATIYNPQFGAGATSVNYTLDGTEYKGKCGQWDLATKNSFKVKLDKAGKYNFTNGRIQCQWWGSPLGSDKIVDNPGAPNLNAPVLGGYFSVLPNFSFDVEGAIETTSVEMNKADVKLVLGETETLTATVLPEDATDKTLTWTSDNPQVVTVDKNGKLSTLSVGEANISAENGGHKATCHVTVKAPELTAISFEKNKGKIYVGDELKLAVTFTPDNVLEDSKELVWTSSEEKVASVDKEGNIKGLKGGKTVITATSKKNPSLKAEFDLKVVEVQINELELDESQLELKAGETADIGYTIVPAIHKDRIKLKWTTSDAKVADVNAEGKVVALGEGEATITASYGNLSETCKVTVKRQATLEGVTATFQPEVGIAGSKMTVKVDGLVVPEGAKGKIDLGSKFSFKTTIPGLKEISTGDLGEITFDIPAGTPTGTYYLTDGQYYLHTAAGRAQGMFPVGVKEVTLFKGEMPVFAFKVKNNADDVKPVTPPSGGTGGGSVILPQPVKPSNPGVNSDAAKNPATTDLKDGWNKVGDNWYYGENGKAVTGWLLDNETWYYLSNSGAMATGWYKVGNTWYHSDNSGAMTTGWLNDNGTWYYLGNSGAMATGWYKAGGAWYHSDNSGAMTTGWFNDNGTWYYLGNSGAMATGWYKVDGTWYYSNSSGAMVTGWQKVDGTWYNFASSGALM